MTIEEFIRLLDMDGLSPDQAQALNAKLTGGSVEEIPESVRPCVAEYLLQAFRSDSVSPTQQEALEKLRISLDESIR